MLFLLCVSLIVSFLSSFHFLFFKRVSALLQLFLRLYFRLGHRHLSILLLSERLMMKTALGGKGEGKPC